MARLILPIVITLLMIAQIQADSREERLKLRWLRDKPAISVINVEGSSFFSAGEIKKRMYSGARSKVTVAREFSENRWDATLSRSSICISQTDSLGRRLPRHSMSTRSIRPRL